MLRDLENAWQSGESIRRLDLDANALLKDWAEARGLEDWRDWCEPDLLAALVALDPAYAKKP